MPLKSNPIDIEGIYAEYIENKQEINRIARYQGNESWYHASGAGSCSRKLYFQSVEQVDPTNIIDDRTNRLLRLGNVVHEDIQNSLMRAGYNNIHNNSILNNKKEIKNKEKSLDFHTEGELEIKELNVRGYYDVIVDDKRESRKVYLYDIKTCGGYSWRLKFGRSKQLNPSIHYELQLGTYGYAVKEKFGQLDGMYLYYYNKDTSAMRAVEVPLVYVSRAYLYWKNLNDEHKIGLPDFKIGVSPVQKWQCNYCQFKDHCNPPT